MVVGDDAQCLSEGPGVTMADGTRRPIETIAPGEQVLSAYGSGEFHAAEVLDVHRFERADGVAITMRSGRRLVSTPEHVHFAGYQGGRTPRPHMTGRRLAISLCGDRRGRTPMHRISLSGSDDTGRQTLERLG